MFFATTKSAVPLTTFTTHFTTTSPRFYHQKNRGNRKTPCKNA
jgi:hypothetical protein